MERSDHSLAELVDALDPDPRVTWVHLGRENPIPHLSAVLRGTHKRVDTLGSIEVSPVLFSQLERYVHGSKAYSRGGVRTMLLVHGWPILANKTMEDYTIKINP